MAFNSLFGRRSDGLSGVPSKRSRLDGLFAYAYRRKAGDRFLFALAALALFASLLWSGAVLSGLASVDVPAHSGTLTEGVVGTPRFVNPVLAVTRADRDLSELVYAGLAKLDQNGAIVPDVAESITVSDDGLTYDVVLRPDVTFHDGTPLTADDVAFTIARIQDPAIGSPLRASWDGVTVQVANDHEVNFILQQPYAPFIENLTVGILPAHIWKDASAEEFPFSQWNSEPVGAGPYEVKDIVRDNSGIPKSYTLAPYKGYYGTPAKIQTLTLKFYPNETKLGDAWNAGEINAAAGLSAETIASLSLDPKQYAVDTVPLPRTFAVFFNQNKSPGRRAAAAREALDAAIDRGDLIDSVLDGYAEPLTSPIPPGFGVEATGTAPAADDSLAAAKEILQNGGWTFNDDAGAWEKKLGSDSTPTTLAFSISTANTPVFEETAEYLRARWAQLGAHVDVKEFDQSDLTQSVIRPRDYEALLFGTVIGRAFDFYSFWHSSQRNDPGLNVALYANITTDAILEDIRTNRDLSARNEAVEKFAAEIEKETPAVFLYAPEFTYVLPRSVTGAAFTGLAEPYERFANVTDWYMSSESIWPIFR
jgi:peptide/nickel transport system substrate-binding protein